eukprot:TRINITY_DN80905_c0_g1_i1.p1 TRINITY_DN80905_c0_g1~~TRINITY_DN80905_c0_g1_i1.p1  ORF type:complete len:690 (-),score=208.27 TRINITY_DN80905_c0_g1_i1:323-2392(-)
MASNLDVGDRLHAKYSDGEYYAAEVLAVSTSKQRAKKPVKVHFVAYDASEDQWMALEDLKSKKIKLPKAPAEAPGKKGKATKAEAPAADLSVLTKGTKLSALAEDGKWYSAEVVGTRRGKTPIKINWVGYTSDSDEWVGADRLRSAALKKGTKAAESKDSKAKSDKADKPKKEKLPKDEPVVSDIGIIGSGVMGSNLALNIADKQHDGKNFHVSLYDTNPDQVKSVLEMNSSYSNLHGYGGQDKLKNFLKSLRKPRKVIMLVPAGKITDAVIKDVSALMEKDDIIMDVGNANFRDQIRRAESLEKRGLRFLGMGVSGGAEGARKGPAFFPGGTLSVWEDVKHIIEAAAAKAEDGRPCATMNGKGGAGSCVKMFHNAGEYAVLQIWGEVHEVMKAYGVAPADQAKILESWKKKKGGRYDGLLDSYMLDITIEVVKAKDSTGAGGADDGAILLDKTMDKTDSKGTGLWSVVEALNAPVPCPSLCAALLARQMSMCRGERLANAKLVTLPKPSGTAKWSAEVEEDLYWATAFAIIASYTQMFQCLRKMDEIFGFGLKLPATIATFRAGCILQGFLLQPMTNAFEDNPDLPSLMDAFEPELKGFFNRYRSLVSKASLETGVTIPCMYASLDYIQTMFMTAIPSAQCVSLQRDVFGRHGFERLDKDGRFNSEWRPMQAGDASTTAAKSAVVEKP